MKQFSEANMLNELATNPMIVMKIGMLTLVLNEWIVRDLQRRSLLP